MPIKIGVAFYYQRLFWAKREVSQSGETDTDTQPDGEEPDGKEPDGKKSEGKKSDREVIPVASGFHWALVTQEKEEPVTSRFRVYQVTDETKDGSWTTDHRDEEGVYLSQSERYSGCLILSEDFEYTMKEFDDWIKEEDRIPEEAKAPATTRSTNVGFNCASWVVEALYLFIVSGEIKPFDAATLLTEDSESALRSWLEKRAYELFFLLWSTAKEKRTTNYPVAKLAEANASKLAVM